MSLKQSKLGRIMENIQYGIEYNLENYKKILQKINSVRVDSLSDAELRRMSDELRYQALNNVALEELLIAAFALVREAADRLLGMRPFDVQIIAGIALHMNKIVEMQTGEGKTLTAVLPAYLNALTGRGVHILTFNDYLARRDAEWMRPVYEFLGLRVGYISEDMSTAERKRAYNCDITYVTAKEAGFDYLRDFLCTDKSELVHRGFSFAVVDEADSILIDEARIPLVIAGNIPQQPSEFYKLISIIKKLRNGKDYNIDRLENNIYLTEEGLASVEKALKCGNLYAEDNVNLLSKINCALYAVYVLERDKDYIVRNGKIEIVDEFTGRIADKRHWPDNIQQAVEAKEGVLSESKGIILNSIALQYFVSLYPKLSGMTGTAYTAAYEFKNYYGKEVVVIPTNKPCIRKDHPDNIFSNIKSKQKAIIDEITAIHNKKQPILIGTSSVEESEQLAASLKSLEIQCEVLNAKNDDMEAKIIAKAGALGAVTVSTNMAGRGVDIKLGGENEQNRDDVTALGGLYVLGTNHYESLRTDSQLRGRAGRQGDPGESKFFISLEDELVQKYNMSKLIPKSCYSKALCEMLDNPVVRKELARAQKLIEGYNSDIRMQLWRYTYIVEQQRQIIHKMRTDILIEQAAYDVLSKMAEEKYIRLCKSYGEAVLQKVEKQLALYYINKCWADYIDYISYIRESIHLVVIGGKNPLHEFNKMAVEGFDNMLEEIKEEIVKAFNAAEITENGIDMEKEGLKGPSSTWTYLVNDSPDQFSNLPQLIKGFATSIKGTLFSLQGLFKKLGEKRKL